MKDVFAGIDLGTSGVKTLLINEDQNIIGSSNASLSVTRPSPGWSEQNPADWIAGTRATFKELAEKYPEELKSVKGIGLSGQMHGATLLDDKGKVLRPCMLWNDTRSHVEAMQLDSDPALREVSGNIVFPGFTAPKVMWVKNNEPDVFKQTGKVLLPKDYLRFWLTGELVSEMSDASGTSWLDVGKRQWSQELLEKSGMHLDQMPDLIEGSESSGIVKPDVAAELGLGTDVVVAGGAGDNAASAIGVGCSSAGEAFLSLGTSGVLFASNSRYTPNAESAVHAFCHALPETWHQMAVILSATDALNWLAGITGKSAAELDQALPASLAEPSGITFLPYLSGERTPHNDANIRGVLEGLHHEANTVMLTKAVLEGVSFAFKDCLDSLAAAGTEITRVTVVGGGSNSGYWLELLATILNVEILVPDAGDFGAAFGAARLGLMAATDANADEICTPPDISRNIVPNASLAGEYSSALDRFRKLYPVIKSIQM